MKKQISKNKLAFNKKAISELNDNQLNSVNGGGFVSVISVISVISLITIASINPNTITTLSKTL